MKKSLKRVLSSMLAATMLIGSSSFIDSEVVPVNSVAPVADAYAASGVNITEAQGWLETAWVEWDIVDGASSYKVYYKGSSDRDYIQIDDMLLRKYGSYWRADILGLPAGDYTVKVSAFDEGGSEIGSAETSVSVEAQDRSGFAFKGETTPGAYKADGSLKDGAQVIYLTNDNFATKQVTLKGKNGDTVTATGFSEILEQLAKAYNVPTAIRIIGRIEPDTYNKIEMSSEDCAEMKGQESGYNKSDPTIEVTIEGVGEDAALGGGTCFNKTAYCEMRNLAVGGFGDDGVAMKTATYMWIHNLDLMYGNAGSDADQAKGDGSIDLKDNSQYVTISYVHFWDSGKCSLCGMKSEDGPNYITYHHNWFDHSDSRHPRIRTMSVHVYNNFFDGNAKYGVGAAQNSSAFVENNVFENCKHPMLSSMQGSDIAGDGDGTFSGENGGIIKAYNNQISGQQSGEPVYYQDDNVEFDAYLASSRDEVVPTSVKAKQGGTTYDNDTLAPENLNATPEPVETVKDTVTKYAGRVNGGDFEWTFTDADDTDYDVNQALKSKVLSYVATTPYTSVGPNEDGSIVETTTTTDPTTETTTNDSGETEETTKEDESTESTTIDPSGAASMGTYEIGKSASGGDFNVVDTDEKYGNIDFSNVRSLDDTGAKLRSGNSIVFTLNGETVVEVTCGSGKDVILSNGSDSYTCEAGTTSTFTVPAGAYTISGAESGSNSLITKIVLTAVGGGEDTSSETTTETTTEESSSETTTETTTEEPSSETTTEATDYLTIDSDMSLNNDNVTGNRYFNVTGNKTSGNNELQIGTSGKIEFTVAQGANVSVTARHASGTAGTADRILTLSGSSGEIETITYSQGVAAKTDVLGTNLQAGTYTITVSNSINITSLDITFTSEPEPSVVKGDANNDGVVTSADVKEILNYVVGIISSVANTEAADVNDDSKVSSTDAYIIQKYINKGIWQ